MLLVDGASVVERAVNAGAEIVGPRWLLDRLTARCSCSLGLLLERGCAVQ